MFPPDPPPNYAAKPTATSTQPNGKYYVTEAMQKKWERIWLVMRIFCVVLNVITLIMLGLWVVHGGHKLDDFHFGKSIGIGLASAAGILVLDTTVIVLTFMEHKYVKDPYFAITVLIDFFAGFLILLALILKCVATIPPESEPYRWASVGLQSVVVIIHTGVFGVGWWMVLRRA
ncbi:hypothetical protein BDV96DRAFT_362187 [Lophiotrema nucula]|uniref:MARVEL domain-containing protein n=1 Tax=Lophiotrema nucula TaxID=690887 RepID=A0A6A5ZHV6_9PLEO|nr:hypothetical protein BDV96DRAFT_362187 [Lophiotrema nucula]